MEWIKRPEFYSRVTIDAIFSIIVAFYLSKLNALNQSLDKNPAGAIAAMQELRSHNNAPIWYFLLAILLVGISLTIVALSFKKIRGDAVAGWTFIMDVLINVYWIHQIWEAINNPIVRLMLLAAGAGAFTLTLLKYS
ncbi:hypothetical protein [Levilactobacillus brevis]|uniref:hypothetical protein n=1 Tax=Levilactobacillus brevis TaxID=1580 RepID=UPI001BDF0B14|nr:hypothetical protein [Levilactobacillus brevis]